METTARVSRRMSAGVALLSAVLIVTVGFAERADSKRFSQKEIKSVSKKRLAGAYSGVTEQGAAMSFKLTKRGKITDFVMPLTLNCRLEIADVDMNGAIGGPGEESDFTKTVTLQSQPAGAWRKKEAHYPFGTVFEYASPPVPADQPPQGTVSEQYDIEAEFKTELQGNFFRPLPKRAAVIIGDVYYATRNAPADKQAPGRERCGTVSLAPGLEGHPSDVDFEAKKRGR